MLPSRLSPPYKPRERLKASISAVLAFAPMPTGPAAIEISPPSLAFDERMRSLPRLVMARSTSSDTSPPACKPKEKEPRVKKVGPDQDPSAFLATITASPAEPPKIKPARADRGTIIIAWAFSAVFHNPVKSDSSTKKRRLSAALLTSRSDFSLRSALNAGCDSRAIKSPA